MSRTYTIEVRRRIEVNTDPQRRCYHGCHASPELQWSAWDWLELDVPEAEVESRLAYWRDLNDYAVSQRGEGARQQFRVIPTEEHES